MAWQHGVGRLRPTKASITCAASGCRRDVPPHRLLRKPTFAQIRHDLAYGDVSYLATPPRSKEPFISEILAGMQEVHRYADPLIGRDYHVYASTSIFTMRAHRSYRGCKTARQFDIPNELAICSK
jgi:hypothetical protein